MTTVNRRPARYRHRRPVVAVLLTVNLLLVGLNLAKRDLLPFSIGPLGGGSDEAAEGADPTTTATAEGGASTASSVVVAPGPARTEVDRSGADWPGGPGPVPTGEAPPRRATLGADGRLQLTGSAPNWGVATKIAQYGAEKLPGGSGAVDNLLTWHPDAPAETQSGEVVMAGAATFAPGGAEIDPGSFPVLDLAAQIMVAHPTVFAVVIGHTDDQGDEADNAELAAIRATAVVDYLVGKGVVPGQLVVAAAGEDDPVADNQTAEGRDANRRTEIQFKNFLISDATLGGRS